MSMLETQGLVKIYGRGLKKRRVVDGVSFQVDKAEIVGLLGPNGAGKTTSFRMACGMIEPDAGQVFLQGVDVTRWPMYRRAREGGMGYLAQESSVFRKLNVEQNLLGMMEMLGVDRKTRRRRCDDLLEQFNIARLRKSLAQSLSGGERRRLEIARSLVSDPKLILLDEPFTGIDPVTIASIQEIIRGLRTNGISILITDHQVRETLQITDRSYVIRDGKVLCHGTPEEVLSNPEAVKYYFGEGIELGPRQPPAPHYPIAEKVTAEERREAPSRADDSVDDDDEMFDEAPLEPPPPKRTPVEKPFLPQPAKPRKIERQPALPARPHVAKPPRAPLPPPVADDSADGEPFLAPTRSPRDAIADDLG